MKFGTLIALAVPAAVVVAMGLHLYGGMLPFNPRFWEPPIYGACEQALKDRLRVPSSYRRIFARSVGTGTLAIEYEAMNALGVRLRNAVTCRDPYAGSANGPSESYLLEITDRG